MKTIASGNICGFIEQVEADGHVVVAGLRLRLGAGTAHIAGVGDYLGAAFLVNEHCEFVGTVTSHLSRPMGISQQAQHLTPMPAPIPAPISTPLPEPVRSAAPASAQAQPTAAAAAPVAANQPQQPAAAAPAASSTVTPMSRAARFSGRSGGAFGAGVGGNAPRPAPAASRPAFNAADPDGDIPF
jgi:hypothetical protein